jgi:acid phosphatase
MRPKDILLALLLAMPALLCAQVPRSNHVVIVVEENHSFSQVIGNPNMPFLNGLASQYSLATQYFANVHPSIGNYFMLTTGQIITNSDRNVATVTADNIVRHLLTAGKTWKGYAESLPSTGYLGPDKFPYTRHHFPLSYFSDVVNSRVQRLNLVPFTQFSKDLANNQLPNYSMIIPNQQDNGHNCPAGTSSCSDAQVLRAMDTWLKSHIGPLLNNSAFRQDGLLIIVFDEGNPSDKAHVGGHIATVLVGPNVKRGVKSTRFYQHQNVLRTVLDALGVNHQLGKAATAQPMTDMY